MYEFYTPVATSVPAFYSLRTTITFHGFPTSIASTTDVRLCSLYCNKAEFKSQLYETSSCGKFPCAWKNRVNGVTLNHNRKGNEEISTKTKHSNKKIRCVVSFMRQKSLPWPILFASCWLLLSLPLLLYELSFYPPPPPCNGILQLIRFRFENVKRRRRQYSLGNAVGGAI